MGIDGDGQRRRKARTFLQAREGKVALDVQVGVPKAERLHARAKPPR